jgi:formiminotetrahydrofolate cyclodeaminase
MVANITLRKIEDDKGKKALESLVKELDGVIDRFLQLVDEDASAFSDVMNAFKMPKDTEEEKNRRREAIQKAFKMATHVPLETARLAVRSGELALIVSEKGEKNAISDVGCAISFINSAFEGARYNIKINLPSIKDGDFNSKVNKEIEELTKNLIGNLCSAKEMVVNNLT